WWINPSLLSIALRPAWKEHFSPGRGRTPACRAHHVHRHSSTHPNALECFLFPSNSITPVEMIPNNLDISGRIEEHRSHPVPIVPKIALAWSVVHTGRVQSR